VLVAVVVNAVAIYPSHPVQAAPREPAAPRELGRRTVQRRLLVMLGLALAAVAIVTLLPGSPAYFPTQNPPGKRPVSHPGGRGFESP
jgi:ferric-dicitrate binding protein FerR (iron transport regulator)